MLINAIASATLLAATQFEMEPPQIGSLAPPLELEHLLQAPDHADTSWSALEGKPVVLEFWATWCGPCVAAIPHMNKLAEQFADDLNFISVTAEGPEIIEPFLKRKPMRSWIGLDTDRSVLNAYGVVAIPQTVLVDASGVIVAVTHPSQLQASHLENLVAGQDPGLTPPQQGGTVTFGGPDPGDANKLFEVSISAAPAAMAGAMGMSTGPGQVKIENIAVPDLIAFAWNVNATRLDVRATLPDDRYTAKVKIPGGDPDRPRELLQHAIQEAFGVSIRTASTKRNVYVLTNLPADGPDLTPAAGNFGTSASTGPGGLQATGFEFDQLVRMLEGAIGAPVENETGLQGRWDVRLAWEQANHEDLIRAVREQLGLGLSQQEREANVLIIEDAVADAPAGSDEGPPR